jgi:hypothetical protein
MKTVIIVSKCLRVTKFNSNESSCEFHFKGVFAGESVRRVILMVTHNFSIKKGEEYLLYVQLNEFKEGKITGQILKAKLLDECWDRS